MKSAGNRYFNNSGSNNERGKHSGGSRPGSATAHIPDDDSNSEKMTLYRTPYPDLLAKLKTMMQELAEKRKNATTGHYSTPAGRKREREEGEEDDEGSKDDSEQSAEGNKRRKMVIIDV